MRHDAPAALPLLAYVTGLAFGAMLVNPRFTIAALLCVSVVLLCSPQRRRGAVALIAIAAGIAISLQVALGESAERAHFESLDAETFTTIEVPLDHSWTERDGSFALRADSFVANGHEFAQTLIVYARFAPPPIINERFAHARGFLRRNERGFYTLTVKSSALLSYRGELAWYAPQRWNRALARRIAPLAATYPVEVALIEALVLGRSERLTDDVRDSFKRGGTYHLLVFSGLQIAVAAGALAWLLRCAHAPRAADWLLLSFAAIAPLFIGATASVSRASAGIGLYAISRIAKRPTSLENLWCVAALVHLIAVPSDLTSAAFHLTYAGAGAMLFIAKPLHAWRWVVAPAAAEIAIVPLTLFHFHQFAIGGSLLTIVMTPVIFVMLLTGAIACAFPLPAVLEVIALLHRLCASLNGAGAHTSGFFAAPPPFVVAVTAMAALIAIMATAGRRRALILAGVLLLPSAAAVIRDFRARAFDGVQFIALDVGQGDALVVRSHDRTILVDGGGRSEATRFGESVLLPLLVDRGVRRIDVVALTHAHPDHCGGLPAVVRNLDVGTVWITPRRFSGVCATTILDSAGETATPIHLARDLDRIALGAIHGTVLLSPSTFRRAPENNSSLVLRIQSGSRRLLLTGDVERDTERALAGRWLPCDVLKVAHHGSRTSTTPELLAETSPRLAVISCGRHNLFGHPHASVVEALRSRAIRVLRTDQDGTITFSLLDRRIFVTREIDTPQ